MTDTDVIIVGAGPTGLMLATELCLVGVKPLVLERLTEIREVAKAGGIGGHILDLLRYRDLGDRLWDAAGQPVTARLPFGGIHIDLTELPESPMQVLRLPQPQLEALMQDYVTSFNAGSDDLKEKLKAAQQAATAGGASNPDAILDSIMKPIGPWMEEKRRLSETFLTNLKSQLGPQQLERWPSFERALRRERLLAESDIAGEGVDLWAVMACKADIKAGDVLTSDEALALIESWQAIPDRHFCPHGRPVSIRWGVGDLEKQFKRRA